MPKIHIKKDGSAMVVYSREELNDIISTSRRPQEQTQAQKIMEKSR